MKVTSQTAKALALDRDSFNMLLGPLDDIIKRGGSGQSNLNKTAKGVSSNPNDKSREKVFRRDLAKIGLLGCGGFGAVELWEHKKSKDTYAMKCLSKGYIVKTGMQESINNEKNILMMTNSPFIVRLYETYNGSQTLYFLMEAALGGELYATYNRKGFHGSEKHAKFYIAGTICGFDHMHTRRIIYRDLKPENLLLADNGQPKVTDMGLAKFVIGKTYTTCGTPDYFAPELIASTGHTNAVDWWTLGILAFELMSGHPPFESAYPMQIYSKVMKGISKVPFPPKCQGNVGDLIKVLLKKEPSERLPMRPGGISNLKDHKWFAGFDWPVFQEQALDPPYKPVVKSKKDIANFSARKEDMPRQIEYVDDGSGWDKEFASSN
jgi:serine/threonine protein kinase